MAFSAMVVIYAASSVYSSYQTNEQTKIQKQALEAQKSMAQKNYLLQVENARKQDELIKKQEAEAQMLQENITNTETQATMKKLARKRTGISPMNATATDIYESDTTSRKTMLGA